MTARLPKSKKQFLNHQKSLGKLKKRHNSRAGRTVASHLMQICLTGTCILARCIEKNQCYHPLAKKEVLSKLLASCNLKKQPFKQAFFFNKRSLSQLLEINVLVYKNINEWVPFSKPFNIY